VNNKFPSSLSDEIRSQIRNTRNSYKVYHRTSLAFEKLSCFLKNRQQVPRLMASSGSPIARSNSATYIEPISKGVLNELTLTINIWKRKKMMIEMKLDEPPMG